MSISDIMQQYKWILLIAMFVVLLIFTVILINQGIRLRKLSKKYQKFIEGKDGKSLEDEILKRFSEIDSMKEELKQSNVKLSEISETLASTYQKMGIVKYDAFKEMGGKLSFAMALLDDSNSGIVINSMHSSREGCYTYAKEIIRGESFVVLSEEEKEALQMALNKKNYLE